jgi:zinc protease
MKNAVKVLWIIPLFMVLSAVAQQKAVPQKKAVAKQKVAAQKQVQKKAPWTALQFRLIDRPGEIVEVLDNGMVAIVKENHTAPVASVRLYVRAGSIYEGEQLGAGLSHLFEHLLAGGATKNRSEDESRKLIEKIGAKFNAYTSKARTCYFLTVPALHVGSALNMIADWVTRPTFPEDAFEREWDVVQRELEMGNTDPSRTMWKLFDKLRYTVHPGRFPIIGHQSIVQQLKREEILAYYKRMYVPDNCVVVIVGDINAEEMLDAIKKEFSDFTRRAQPTIVLPDEPEVTAPREIVKVFPAMQGPAKMNIGFPSFKLQHKDLYALDTLANIMGEGKSSRLYKRLREELQLVLSISAGNYTPYWADGTFTIMCELAPNKVADARSAIWDEIERIKKEPVTDQELARAKRQLQVGYIRSHQTAEQQAGTMAEDYLATGDPHFSDHYVENMQKVTAEHVRETARQYLVRDKQLTLVLTPDPLSPVAAGGQKKNGESAIKQITLDNGLRILLRRNTAVPLVNTQFYVIGGLLDETEANNGLTNLMTMLSVKGTKKYTSQQINEFFDNIGGSIQAGCGNNTYFYRMEVMTKDFSQAFGVFTEVVREPTFAKEELAKVGPLVLANIEKVHNSWPAEGARFFRKNFFTNSPYNRTYLGTADSVQAISRKKIIDFHTTATVGSRSVLAIFGDINLDDTERMVREKFSGLPKGKPLDLNKFKPEPPLKAPREFLQKTSKEGATVHVGFPGMKLTNVQDRYPMDVLTGIIGSNTGWLHELLRGKGLVYYAWGFSFAGLTPGYIAATAQCEAEKAPDVLKLIQEQLQKAAEGNITEEEVARAKSKLINSEILGKQTNADMASAAALDELYGFGYKWSQGHADRILAVTLENVKAVAKKYLSVPPTATINTSKPELFSKKPPKPIQDNKTNKPKPAKKKK